MTDSNEKPATADGSDASHCSPSAKAERLFGACAGMALSLPNADPIGVFDKMPHGQGKNSELRAEVFAVWKRRQSEYPFFCPQELPRE